MKIPKKIKICGQEIDVKQKRNYDQYFQDSLGEWHQEKMTIFINQKLPAKLKEEVFCHEVVEAINSLFDLELDHWKIQVLGLVSHQVFFTEDSNG